ncbi:MAG: DUF6624 domain-containing protein [Acidobacteriota bacterium]
MRQHAMFVAGLLVLAMAAHAFEEPVAKDNAELARLYDEDQKDREQGPNANIDWPAVSKRDDERRERVRQIVAQGGANTSTDYYNAAMIYQHGSEVPDYDEANRLALKAVEIDPANKSARWLAAAAKDRSLMWQGKPQLYGTQFKKVDGRWILWEVDPATTDEERARWNVPPLEEQRKKLETLNAKPPA